MDIIEMQQKDYGIQLLIDKLIVETKVREPIYDGINCIEEYIKAKYKILFILKEPYDSDGGGWAIKDIISKGQYGKSIKTFYPLIYIAYGILNHFKFYNCPPGIIYPLSLGSAMRRAKR